MPRAKAGAAIEMLPSSLRANVASASARRRDAISPAAVRTLASPSSTPSRGCSIAAEKRFASAARVSSASGMASMRSNARATTSSASTSSVSVPARVLVRTAANGGAAKSRIAALSVHHAPSDQDGSEEEQINPERLQRVRAEVLQQELDANEAEDRRGDEADRQNLERQLRLGMLVQIEDRLRAGADDDHERQEERKARRTIATASTQA